MRSGVGSRCGEGRRQAFPEIDRVAWFDLALAREKLVQGQVALLDRLAEAGSGERGG